MSLWTKIEDACAAGYTHVKSWFAPEVDGGKELLTELESEVERIGPQLIFDVSAAALTAVASGATGGMTTGAFLTAAADIAIARLKSEGKQDVTVAVYGALAGSMLKMDATAKAQGVTTGPSAA